MIDFTFNNPIRFYFGKDSLPNLSKELLKANAKKVLLVFGSNSLKASGNYDKITANLQGNDIEWFDFGGNSQPSLERIEEGIEFCKANDIQAVIGIGGATCIDMAKVIGYGVKNDNVWDKLSKTTFVEDYESLIVGAIPTYPSGGSEADNSAEVDHLAIREHGTLLGLYPDFSILSPEFSYTLNEKNTALGAMVTYIQVSVNYLGNNSSPIAEGFIETLLKVLVESTERLIESGNDYDARANVMWASSMSTFGLLSSGKNNGWAFQIYSDIEILRKWLDIPYRQAILTLFPNWLVQKAHNHEPDVYKYFDNTLLDESKTRGLGETIIGGSEELKRLFNRFDIETVIKVDNKAQKLEELETILKETDFDFDERVNYSKIFAACIEE